MGDNYYDALAISSELISLNEIVFQSSREMFERRAKLGSTLKNTRGTETKYLIECVFVTEQSRAVCGQQEAFSMVKSTGRINSGLESVEILEAAQLIQNHVTSLYGGRLPGSSTTASRDQPTQI